MFGILRRSSSSRSARRSSGEVLILNTDGSVLVDRRGKGTWRPILPVKPIIQIALVVTAVKLLLLADLGAGEYYQRSANLRAGAGYERVGSSILVLDPITTDLVSNLTRWTR